MTEKFKPVAFQPSARRSSHAPRWLVLLLIGVTLGAAGLAVIQEIYLPKRLTHEASARLRTALERADAERKGLELELGETKRRLEAALAESKSSPGEIGAARAAAQRLRDDLAAVIAALPPDPRGGSVEVRSGRFSAKGGVLNYEMVLTRDLKLAQAGTQTLPATVQLLATGQDAGGAEATLSLAPLQLALGSHEVPRGSLSLPEGFKPRQVSVQVLDRENGKQLGLRVFLVRS
ncbi:MAG: hypothetical protein JHC40_15070 [Burkholderiales bacterium]|nr:hypothetical protein [Burkholderiales bacterium]